MHQSLRALTPKQIRRLDVIADKIISCEGTIPEKFWCEECKSTMSRFYRLIDIYHTRNMKSEFFVHPTDRTGKSFDPPSHFSMKHSFGLGDKGDRVDGVYMDDYEDDDYEEDEDDTEYTS